MGYVLKFIIAVFGTAGMMIILISTLEHVEKRLKSWGMTRNIWYQTFVFVSVVCAFCFAVMLSK